MTRTDYVIETRTGAVVCTFDDWRLATDRARAMADEHPGLRVVEVIRTERRRTVWSEAHRLVDPALTAAAAIRSAR